jgi:hypothetical protein
MPEPPRRENTRSKHPPINTTPRCNGPLDPSCMEDSRGTKHLSPNGTLRHDTRDPYCAKRTLLF